MPAKVTGYDPQKEHRANLLGWAFLSLALVALFIATIIQLSLTPLWILSGGAAITVFLVSLKPKYSNS